MGRPGPYLLVTVMAAAALAGPAVTGTAGPVPRAAESSGRTEVVSVAAGEAGRVGAAEAPAVSADGRYVAFESTAALDPVVPTDNQTRQIYLRDLRSPDRTILISRGVQFSSAGSAAREQAGAGRTSTGQAVADAAGQVEAVPETGGNGPSSHPSLSADGRYVAFVTQASNLQLVLSPGGVVTPLSGPPGSTVVVCDRDPDGDLVFDERDESGRPDHPCLEVRTDVQLSWPRLSATADLLAWRSGNDNGQTFLQLARLTRDQQGRLAATVYQPAAPGLTSSALEPAGGDPPAVSADGRSVAFTADQCEPDSELCVAKPLVFDVRAGQVAPVDLLSGEGRSGGRPAISGNGRLVAYERQTPSEYTEVVVADRDPRGTGQLDSGPVGLTLVTRASDGGSQAGRSPALSVDGRYLAYTSAEDDQHNGQPGTGRTALVVRDLVVDAAQERAGLPRPAGELASPSVEQVCSESPEPGRACPTSGGATEPALAGNGSMVTFVSAGNDLLAEPCCTGAVFARTFRATVSAEVPGFGTSPVGTPVSRTITLRHHGFGPLALGAVSVTGSPEFRLANPGNCTGTTLHRDQTCTLEVAFTPTGTGARQGVLQVRQADGTVAESALTGEGTPAVVVPGDPDNPGTPDSPDPGGAVQDPAGGQLVVTPDPVDLPGAGPALVPTRPVTLLVRNASTRPLTVTAPRVLSGPGFVAGEFAVTATTCRGITLPPRSTCVVTVVSTPQLPGPRSGVLEIPTTTPGFGRLVPLRSTASALQLVVNPGVVRPNRVVTVTGRGFPPNRPVALALPGSGVRSSGSARTAADGSFSASLLVFDQTGVGTWPLTATVPGTGLQARADVLVVSGSFQPPGFTSRR